VPAGRLPGATASDAGVLRPVDVQRHVQIWRAPAADELSSWLERYWSVRWDLPAQTSYTSEVLTHPAVHLSLESGSGPRHGHDMPAALLHGVVTRRFSVQLFGQGRVFGVKFRPGGFGAFTGANVADYTDLVIRLADVFGPASEQLLRDVLAMDSDVARAAAMDDFLLARAPEPDPRYHELLGIIATMLGDPGLTSVQDVVDECGTSARRLQRLFRRYVGVGPKWVLQRFRLHDAMVMLESGSAPELATMAVQLGWFDQAHFSRDFADTVGVSPAGYATSH
jgi:AraC-like DNA-binding protein